MNIAEQVIEIMGGAQAVASITGVDVSRVHRWKYEKARGGTGGLIPARYQGQILDEAKKQGIGLEPDDFFHIRPASQRSNEAA